MKHRPPLVLAILDGWGCRGETHGNAIAAAQLPHWQRILATYPWTEIEASGEAVGLPPGVMGNSEVGHINLGSGRVVPQGIVVIDTAIAAGELPRNAALTGVFSHLKASGGTLRLMGLLSDGKVHSSQDHLEALIDAAIAAGVPFVIDAFLDGRDTAPRSAATYLGRLEAFLAARGRTGSIATVCGRYYAMDRDKRWDRTERAYHAIVDGDAPHRAASANTALDEAYAREEYDEFVPPTIVGEVRPLRDGDAIVFFNFRPDRARQLTLALSDPAFHDFTPSPRAGVVIATMTRYEEHLTNPVLFGPRPQSETLGEIVADAGWRQLRVAETEKYAHVTYFFNGGREEAFAGEERILIPSNRTVATYDKAPEMMAADVTSAVLASLAHHEHDVIVVNYANADMVGHTGDWKATISALETLDVALGRLEQAVRAAGGLLAITADHGNAEEKIDADGNPLTAHTTNTVPFVLVGERALGTLRPGGKLGDVAPTLLPLMGLPTPTTMTGTDLRHG